ncbi:MAG: acyl-[acyl-carrier-protein] thioesterase [Spirochaetaceae bacterium]|nr:acyl-[acyl-carrier-protein] thioesterase [Spirochaetaceae bacterium]
MTTFKQWHEGNTFYRELKLYFAQCDKHQRQNLSDLLQVTSDSAVEDYHQRGMTYDVLKENKIAILVSRASYKIHQYPQANAMVTVKTWEEPPEGLQLCRRYDIYSQSGDLLVSGSSTWLVVNLENRRIMRPADFKMREPPTEKFEFPGLACGKINIPEKMELLDERTIRYSDIDANGHVNNSRYGNYIVDCLPEEYQQKTITDFRINYSQEAILGDKLQLFACFDNPNKIVVVGKTPSGTCFESELYY